MKVLFTEIQRFRQWWVWAILLISSGFSLYIVYSRTNGAITTLDLIFTISILISVVLLIWFLKLETKITEKHIQVKYFPFVNKTFLIEEIEMMKVINYGFVGGWGIRFWTPYGTVYNTSGNKGLHFQLKNGKRYVIGTQNPEELQKIINQISK